MTNSSRWWAVSGLWLVAACASQGDGMRVVIPQKTTYLHAEAVDGGPVDVPPRVLEEVRPATPGPLADAGDAPSVVLSFLVDATGRIDRIRVDRTGDDRLIGPAVEAISRWQLRPALRDGRPVPVTATVQLTFDAPGAAG